MKSSEYDGFYFLPHGKYGEDLKFSYFSLKDDDKGTPVGGNDFGDMYHVVMFKEDKDGFPVFDDAFDAILGDPQKYVENLLGAELYGCVLRKTDKSNKWLEDYLTRVMGSVIMNKLNFLK